MDEKDIRLLLSDLWVERVGFLPAAFVMSMPWLAFVTIFAARGDVTAFVFALGYPWALYSVFSLAPD